MLHGTPKADALACRSITADMTDGPSLVAVLHLIDATKGGTYATTRKTSGWSPRTLQLLRELADAVERDTSVRLFHEGVGQAAQEQEPDTGSLMDHLSTEGIPQG